LQFAKENEIDLTIVGPEVPLVAGIVDEFEKENLKVFGPNKKCAQLEGSKAFSKDFMIRHNLPTAKYKEYTDLDKAIDEIDEFGYPVVIKADGLAAGKGVVIPENREDAIETLKEMMADHKFGHAGDKIVIEEFLTGIETSILAF
ncbi:phosphoribosylamine--glycine ligase, partial [Clostridioides difficile]